MASNPYFEIPADTPPSLVDDIYRAYVAQEAQRYKQDNEPGFWETLIPGLARSMPSIIEQTIMQPNRFAHDERMQGLREQAATTRYQEQSNNILNRQMEVLQARQQAEEQAKKAELDRILAMSMDWNKVTTGRVPIMEDQTSETFPVGGAEPPVMDFSVPPGTTDLRATEVSPDLAPTMTRTDSVQVGDRSRNWSEVAGMLSPATLALHPAAKKYAAEPGSYDAVQSKYMADARERLTKQVNEERVAKARKLVDEGSRDPLHLMDAGLMKDFPAPSGKDTTQRAQPIPFQSRDEALARQVTDGQLGIVELTQQASGTDPILARFAQEKLAQISQQQIDGRPPATRPAGTPNFPAKFQAQQLLGLIATNPEAAAEHPVVQMFGGPAEAAGVLRTVLAQADTPKPAAARPPTAAQIKAEATGMVHEQVADEIAATAREHPEWFGGPFGAKSQFRNLQTKLGGAPEGFPQFRSKVNALGGSLGHELAGAALTATEKKIYLRWIPNLDDQSSQEFLANLETTKQLISTFRAYNQQLKALGWKPKPGDNVEQDRPLPLPQIPGAKGPAGPAAPAKPGGGQTITLPGGLKVVVE